MTKVFLALIWLFVLAIDYSPFLLPEMPITQTMRYTMCAATILVLLLTLLSAAAGVLKD